MPAFQAGIFFVNVSTRLSRNAYRVPGSAFYFVSSLAFMVGYLFVNASQGVGDEIVVTQIVLVFIWVSGLFRANFSKPPHRGCPTPKRAKKRSFCMYSALVVAAHSLFRNIGLKSYWSLCWVLCRIARVLCCLMCRPVWLIDTGCFLSFDLNRIGSSLPSEKVAVWYLYARSR